MTTRVDWPGLGQQPTMRGSSATAGSGPQEPQSTELGFWLVSRYADCLEVLRNPIWSSDTRNAVVEDEFTEHSAVLGLDVCVRPHLFFDPPSFIGGRPFLCMDGEAHRNMRTLVFRQFTPAAVLRLRQRAIAIARDLFLAAAADDAIDVVIDLAQPLSVGMICEILGLEAVDLASFTTQADALGRSLDPDASLSEAEREQARQAMLYFGVLLLEEFGRPGVTAPTGLIADLVRAHEEGAVTMEDALSACILLLLAGHETTVNLLGNAALVLAQDPRLADELRRRPDLLGPAVDEWARHDSPVQIAARTATADLRLGNAVIPRGRQVVLLLGRANRDPTVFPQPDSFALDRPGDPPHLAFGWGSHRCVGAPLARLEATIALDCILSGTRRMRLATDPVRKEGVVLNGLASLPVHLDVA